MLSMRDRLLINKVLENGKNSQSQLLKIYEMVKKDEITFDEFVDLTHWFWRGLHGLG